MKAIKGFSKLNRQQKIDYIRTSLGLSDELEQTLEQYRHPDKQALFDDFSENTLSNYLLPFGVAPNFVINDTPYIVPMVIEESSVVAAASRAAGFWADNGGFNVTIHGTEKVGHLWFLWEGTPALLLAKQFELATTLKKAVAGLTLSMEQRGGGITGMLLIPQSEMESVWQLQVLFNTADSMGANFINSCLEEMRAPLIHFFEQQQWQAPEIIMAILSNHTPNCLVTCEASCNVQQLAPYSGDLSPEEFARRFKLAMDIAGSNPHRAVTHNKGIFNGIDAVVIATGNDFRAVEAAGHAFAAQSGQYRSLSACSLTNDGLFTISLTLPMALGTVGGLTKLHPLANLAMKILNNPSATELMGIVASAGLANNFSAVASLVTTGIQKGHMKLHLSNILNGLEATEWEKARVHEHFQDATLSHKSVVQYLTDIRTHKDKLSQTFHANGKLLLTGEYLVLKGARAIALPLNKGQEMEVERWGSDGLKWQAFIPSGLWFEAVYAPDLGIVSASDDTLAQRLQQILLQAMEINPATKEILQHKRVTTTLAFNPQWGWGSSSTLLSLLGQWLDIDTWQLMDKTFGGSGYDLACAVADHPIFYKRIAGQTPETERAVFNPPFLAQLGVVWLKRKQTSSHQARSFLSSGFNDKAIIDEISAIGQAITTAATQDDFNQLLKHHEQIIASITGETPVKKRLFADFNGQIKSLGAWGGDFVLFSGDESLINSIDYFKTKGYTNLFKLEDILLNKTD